MRSHAAHAANANAADTGSTGDIANPVEGAGGARRIEDVLIIVVIRRINKASGGGAKLNRVPEARPAIRAAPIGIIYVAGNLIIGIGLIDKAISPITTGSLTGTTEAWIAEFLGAIILRTGQGIGTSCGGVNRRRIELGYIIVLIPGANHRRSSRRSQGAGIIHPTIITENHRGGRPRFKDHLMLIGMHEAAAQIGQVIIIAPLRNLGPGIGPIGRPEEVDSPGDEGILIIRIHR